MFSNLSGGMLFNFIQTIYQIQVDLITGFSTEIDLSICPTVGDGGVETFDVGKNITVYQCNDTYKEITSPPELTQGGTLQICECEEKKLEGDEKGEDEMVNDDGENSHE